MPSTLQFKFTLPLIIFFLLILAFSAKLILDHGEDFTKSPLIGKTIPEFSLPVLSGKKIKSEDLKGGMKLINFFASWCEACSYEQSALAVLTKETSVPIYGVAWKDKAQKTKYWLKKFGNPYQEVGEDRDGEIGMEFGITGVPETFLIGKDGRVLFRQAGPIDKETYDNLLKAIEAGK